MYALFKILQNVLDVEMIVIAIVQSTVIQLVLVVMIHVRVGVQVVPTVVLLLIVGTPV